LETIFYPGETDWAATGTWFQGWVGLVAAVVVYMVAREGFGVWVRQKQAERKIAAAEEILTFVYRAKEVFPSIRMPMQLAPELARAEAKLAANYGGWAGLPKTQKERLATGQVYLDRLSANDDLWTKLWDCLPLARAFFGAEFEEKVRSVWQQRAHIHTAAQMYGTVDPQSQAQLVDRFELDLWDGWAEAAQKPDRVGDAIKSLVEESEKLLLPVISDSGWPQRRN
jgi:hypothetical protein